MNQKNIVVILGVIIVFLTGIVVYFTIINKANQPIDSLAQRQSISSLEKNEIASTQISAPAIKFEGRYIDVHTHIMPSGMSLEEMIKNMDIEGIDTMIIMETPTSIYMGKSQEEYGIPSASEKYPNRFISLYGGEAMTLLDIVIKKGGYTQSQEEKYTALLEDAMKSGKYKGFGEIALTHISLGGVGADVTIPGDHPWMFIMSDIAAKYDLPIDVHMDVATANEGIAGLEKLLDHNKNTKIIWSHTAWSRTNYKSGSIELMRRLFEKHPNLYSSVKIQTETAFMDGGVGMKQQPQKGTGRGTKQLSSGNGGTKPPPQQGLTSGINLEWLALFKEYPERFMMGSDIKPGERPNEFAYIKAHRKFLEQLPAEILKQIERNNAKEIFKIN
ncbi:MAG: amidohydrolase family protein [Candidatus Moranbacteria bacterium]|nr:amidohydrolase family protein [Candidatus Moranbacteria bacterium]